MTAAPVANVEAERAALGALLLDNSLLAVAIACIPAEPLEQTLHPPADKWGRPLPYEPLFYSPANQIIFRAIFQLCESGRTANSTMLAEVLNQGGILDAIGGAPYLIELQSGDDVFALSQLPQYLDIIVQKWTLRRVVRLSERLIQLASNGAATAEIAAVQSQIHAISVPTGNAAPDFWGINDLMVRPAEDPLELIRHRFLCRQMVALLIGYSGTGKSTMALQAAVCWALGRPFMGLEPVGPIKTVMIQDENPALDMRDMLDGIFQGLAFSQTEKDQVDASVKIYNARCIQGAEFAQAARKILAAEKPQLLIVDNLHRYAEGIIQDAEPVKIFLHQYMEPIANELDVAILIVHHTPKPPMLKDQITKLEQLDNISFGYIGFGSSVLANSPRASLIIHPMGNRLYALIAGKRGQHLRWVDDDGQTPVNYKLISFHSNHKIICWATPSKDQTAKLQVKRRGSAGRPPKATTDNVFKILAAGDLSKKDLRVRLIESCDCSRTIAYEVIEEAIATGKIVEAVGLLHLCQSA